MAVPRVVLVLAWSACLGLCRTAYPLAVESLTLIDASVNAPAPGFDPLEDGAKVNLAALRSRSLNIRANTSPATVGSVRFALDGNPNFRTENTAPYALAGDRNGDYYPWTPALGEHTVTATRYGGDGASGTVGEALTVRFLVVDEPLPPVGDVLFLYGAVPPATPGHAANPEDSGPLGFCEFASVVREVGFTPTGMADGSVTLTEEFLKPFTIVVFGSNNRRFTGEEQEAALEFVARGGGLLFFSDGAFGFEEGRASDNDLLRHFGMVTHHDNAGPLTTVSGGGGFHYLTDGISFRGEGVSQVRAAGESARILAVCGEGEYGLHIDDGFLQENDAALVVAEHGLGRVAATFDGDTFLNPPGTGTHIDEGDNREYARRLIRWLAHHEPVPATASVTGEPRVWHRVTLTFDGPPRREEGGANPFLDYRMDVVFSRDGREYRVPGFFAADGDAGETSATFGRVWRAHFVPDEAGEWSYRVSFRFGADAAVADDPLSGDPVSFDGAAGSFVVHPIDGADADPRDRGMLWYAGEHHLRFAATGERFLKAGADSPENFLGYFEFDGTFDTGGILPGFLHHYAPHAEDWRPGDPTWQGGKGKNIVGALNYLAAAGGNSVYFITYNIDGGDGADTWPWTTPPVRDRFDCSKLDQWEIVLSHMDRLGIQLHLLTQETENNNALDGGELGPVRSLYYRELVARFAHHLALTWNLGEENTNTDRQRQAFAAFIRRLDPYDHPITVHTFYNHAGTYYDALLGDPHFEATSIQGDGAQYNAWAIDLRRRSAGAGRPWAIYGDEQGPAVDANMGNLDVLRRTALWGNLMGGGAGVEWYFGYQGDFGDLQSEDWRKAAPLWAMTRHALEFFRDHLPFWEMAPANELASEQRAFVLAKPGEVYAVYLPDGGTTELELTAGTFAVWWYDPRRGGDLLRGSTTRVTGPGRAALGRPPGDASRDWAALIRSASSADGEDGC